MYEPHMEGDASISDSNLAVLSAKGCEASFRILFDRYYHAIHSYAWKLCCDSSTADDIAQQTFIKAANALPKNRLRSEFKPWIYKIALNTARDHLRSSSRYQERLKLLKELPSEQHNSPPDFEEIAHALDKLSPSHREAVLLVCVQGLTQKEAATVLGCPEGTVSWRISEARKAIAANTQ